MDIEEIKKKLKGKFLRVEEEFKTTDKNGELNYIERNFRSFRIKNIETADCDTILFVIRNSFDCFRFLLSDIEKLIDGKGISKVNEDKSSKETTTYCLSDKIE